ncbi:hypothetical protein HYPSUDRAFT_73506 [Hypholoma sublateritium FD-334 SS-4]|uniref:Uncharacterized protein n=1 Tax=Hypholoma sublateritium (strain FD-334 SS-4) TaxID=945553 RepID=A0A0D2PGQ3_HYPSF|nr:hypothetical protein HYPSUDRAFT_73506 [Hypholoma sublateritium FD-334 SS-4]
MRSAGVPRTGGRRIGGTGIVLSARYGMRREGSCAGIGSDRWIDSVTESWARRSITHAAIRGRKSGQANGGYTEGYMCERARKTGRIERTRSAGEALRDREQRGAEKSTERKNKLKTTQNAQRKQTHVLPAKTGLERDGEVMNVVYALDVVRNAMEFLVLIIIYGWMGGEWLGGVGSNASKRSGCGRGHTGRWGDCARVGGTDRGWNV